MKRNETKNKKIKKVKEKRNKISEQWQCTTTKGKPSEFAQCFRCRKTFLAIKSNFFALLDLIYFALLRFKCLKMRAI